MTNINKVTLRTRNPDAAADAATDAAADESNPYMSGDTKMVPMPMPFGINKVAVKKHTGTFLTY